MSEYPPRSALARKEPLEEEILPGTTIAANDEEVVFNAPAPNIEAANDNEKGFIPPSRKVEAANDNEAVLTKPVPAVELANDNDIMAPGDEERLRVVLERLNTIRGKEKNTVSEESPETPESVELSTAENAAEKAAGRSESSTIIVMPAASAGSAARSSGGGEGLTIVEKGEKKKRRGIFAWTGKILKFVFKGIAGILGAAFALSMTTALKITDRAMKVAGAKGEGGGAKKPAGGGGHH